MLALQPGDFAWILGQWVSGAYPHPGILSPGVRLYRPRRIIVLLHFLFTGVLVQVNCELCKFRLAAAGAGGRYGYAHGPSHNAQNLDRPEDYHQRIWQVP